MTTPEYFDQKKYNDAMFGALYAGGKATALGLIDWGSDMEVEKIRMTQPQRDEFVRTAPENKGNSLIDKRESVLKHIPKNKGWRGAIARGINKLYDRNWNDNPETLQDNLPHPSAYAMVEGGLDLAADKIFDATAKYIAPERMKEIKTWKLPTEAKYALTAFTTLVDKDTPYIGWARKAGPLLNVGVIEGIGTVILNGKLMYDELQKPRMPYRGQYQSLPLAA